MAQACPSVFCRCHKGARDSGCRLRNGRFQHRYCICACIAFGIRNFEHREDALQEIRRVLRPGGKLVILELSVPEAPILRWLYNLYFTHVLPWIGGLISGDKAAYHYLPALVLKFPGRKEWTATMA